MEQTLPNAYMQHSYMVSSHHHLLSTMLVITTVLRLLCYLGQSNQKIIVLKGLPYNDHPPAVDLSHHLRAPKSTATQRQSEDWKKPVETQFT